MDTKFLEKKSSELRIDILKAIYHAKKGHIGGAYSCLDILIALYYGDVLRLSNDPSTIDRENRDRFVLSKGHSGIALYVVLADLGFFDKSEVYNLNNFHLLGEHPDGNIPGVEVNTGSLGHGLGVGSGMALASKMDNSDFNVFVLLGDGECHEGSVWEAAMFAAHHGLNNLCAIVDRNMLCVHGYTEDINRLEPFAEKWRAFNWEVRVVDGHAFSVLLPALKEERDKPLVVIADTVKGKGVSFMEGRASWHHGSISDEYFQQACKELSNEG
jgi:transketolase